MLSEKVVVRGLQFVGLVVVGLAIWGVLKLAGVKGTFQDYKEKEREPFKSGSNTWAWVLGVIFFLLAGAAYGFSGAISIGFGVISIVFFVLGGVL